MIKKIIAISILLFFFLFTYGQNTVFLNKYSATSEITFDYIIVSHDSNYIVAGETFSPNGGNYFLLKTDRSGNEIWRKKNNLWTVNYDSSTTAECILETSNHELIICGSLISLQGGYNSQFYISKTDSAGNKLWDLSFGSSENEALSKVIELTTGEFMAIGRKSYSNGLGDLFIVKFNSLGDTLWTKSYNYNQYTSQGVDLIEDDSKIILTGILYDTIAQLNKGLVTIIDSVGAEINHCILIDSINVWPVSFRQTGINEFSVLSYNFSSTLYGTVIYLDTLLIEISRLQILFSPYSVWLNDSSFTILYPDTYTEKYNKNGQNIWINHSFEEFSIPRHATSDYEGNVLVCGSIDDGLNTSAEGFILKIADTTDINNSVANNEVQNKNIFFYTNQITNETFIHVNKEFLLNSDSIILIMYDIYGKECNRQVISQPVEILNKKNILTGVYSYLFSIDNNKISSGKILIVNK